ncbi:MAG: ROK family protein [bacterium]|nr:ROK family protein [bacterium]
MKTYAFAVDLGATNVRVGLICSDGRIIERLKVNTPRHGKTPGVIPQKIAAMLESVASKHRRIPILGVGVSSMGPLDYRRGGPLSSPNIPFAFVPLVAPLSKRFNLPVVLLNDCNAAVLGEQRFGAGRRRKNILYITISTGIGAGALVDGRLVLGRSGNAAEVGHMVIDTALNLPCTCGTGAGHWEGYASGRNIPRFFEAWTKANGCRTDFEPTDSKDLFERARAGESLSRRFLEELHRINGRAISNCIVAYDPEIITLGGSVALQNPTILAGIKKYADRYLALPKIQRTPLGDDAGLLGAAAAVFARGRQ